MAFNASPNYPGSYLGVRAPHPPNVIEANFIPGPANWQNVVVGDIWIYEPSNSSAAGRSVYMLISLVGNQATWTQFTTSSLVVFGLTTDDSGVELPNPATNLITLSGDGVNIFTSAAGSYNARVALTQNVSITSLTATGGPITSISTDAAPGGGMIIKNFVNSNVGSTFVFSKGRDAGSIASGDTIGDIEFIGIVGAQNISAASIGVVTSGTVGTNRLAGNLVFSTHPDSASGLNPTARMYISSAGNVTIFAPDSGSPLILDGLTNGVLQVDGSSNVIASNGTNGQVLIGGGTAPAWANIVAGANVTITNGTNSITIAASGGGSGSIAITGDSGGTLTNSAFTFTGGSSGLTFAGSGMGTFTLGGDLVVANGGTGFASATSHGVLYGNGTSALGVTAAGTTNTVLLGTTSSAPSWGQVPNAALVNDSITVSAGSGISVSGGSPVALGGTVTITATGNASIPYTSVTTSPYAALSSDLFLGVTTSSLAITVQLPNAPATGQNYVIKDVSGNAATNNITVTTVGGSVTIDGVTSYTMNTNYESINVLFNGSAYLVY
jgi:hypothetical protein